MLLKSYWPISSGKKLNEAVANLFCRTKNKIELGLINKSKFVLALDSITPKIKEKLLIIVLQEFEAILLDIVEFELNIKTINVLNLKILYDLINKSSYKFLHNILQKNQKTYILTNTKDLYVKSLLKDNKVALKILIICLLFGSSEIPYNLFNTELSYQYVEFFLQNLIIRISDLIIYLIYSTDSIYDKTSIDLSQSITLNSKYLSIRAIEELRNNIIYQSFKYFYIDQPKAIYSNKYQISILSPKGILSKMIYINRISELENLSRVQLVIPSLLEIQDFFLPRLKYTVFIIGKTIIYFSLNIISRLIKFFFRRVVRSFKRIN